MTQRVTNQRDEQGRPMTYWGGNPEQASSNERDDPPKLSVYEADWSKRGYEPHIATMLAKADWSEDMIAWQEGEIDRLHRELEHMADTQLSAAVNGPAGEPAQQLTTLSSPRSALWRHMHDEHGLTLLESELDEIELLAKACSADEPPADQSDVDYLMQSLVDQESALNACEALLRESLAEDGVNLDFDLRLERFWKQSKALSDWRSRNLRLSQPPVPERARLLSEWSEAQGPVVWWAPPVREPSWIGQPGDSDWPGYHTHWTPHPKVPANIKEQQCVCGSYFLGPEAVELRDSLGGMHYPKNPCTAPTKSPAP